MEQIIKQCFGIDIAKSDFTVTFAQKNIKGHISYSTAKTFDNNKKGFNQFIRWSNKIVEKKLPSLYLMEATGIYYESLAYHLFKIKKQVVVLLPNKVKHYAKSLNIKTKTDAVDSKVISTLGVERDHTIWEPPKQIFKELRELTRFYLDLKKEITVFSNKIESIKSGESPNKFTLESYQKIVTTLTKQVESTILAIQKQVKEDKELYEKIKKLQTIKGVGFISIVIVLAETQGFANIKNRKQLTSYAGFDIVQNESGTSVKGKTRISKKGNGRIRSALYFPAMVASRFNPDLKEDYLRIIKNKTSKKVGIVALERKMLLLMYALWKNNEVYLENKDKCSGNMS